MQRIDSRTVELSPLENDIFKDMEEWDEATDPVSFIHDKSAEYGGVVQEDFVMWLAANVTGRSVTGYETGKPFAGSTIAGLRTHRGKIVMVLADGRMVDSL